MDILYFLSQQVMFFSIPLLIAALGGMFSEAGGVVNIAIEGIMIMGAFAGVLFIGTVQAHAPGMPGQAALLAALAVSALAGALFSTAHAFASVRMKADQVVSGTALNLFAPAFAIFTARMTQPSGVQQISFADEFRVASVPVLGGIPVLGSLLFQNTYLTTLAGFVLLAASWAALYKTRFGLRLRSCGQNPDAARAAGVNVRAMRYAGVLISGALAGMGGLAFIIPTSTNFNATVSGYGFLALAVLIFGQWNPKRIFLAAFFFGLMKAVSASYQGIPFLPNIHGPVYSIIPYAATLIVLAFTSRDSAPPKGLMLE